MPDSLGAYDILIAGGGNAALCAAITAAERGARVLVVEAAPRPYRGGNTRHTRNFRCMHAAPAGTLTDAYPEDEYLDDLMRVTGGKTDEELLRLTIRESEGCLGWMQAHGVRFQPSLSGTLSLSRTNAFFLGGGKALLNAYYLVAGRLGVEVTALREGLAEPLESQDGVMTADESAETLVSTRGSDQPEPRRSTEARALVRALVEAQRNLAAPRWTVRRSRSGHCILVARDEGDASGETRADSQKLADYAERLGREADALAGLDRSPRRPGLSARSKP